MNEHDQNKHVLTQLLNARIAAKAAAGGDADKEAKHEKSFSTFLAGIRPKIVQAAEGDPHNPTAICNVARLREHGDNAPEEAERLYVSALAADPSHVYTLTSFARFRSVHGDANGAAELYAQARASDPGDPDVLFEWASLLVASFQDLEGAKSLINDMVAISPKYKDHKLVKLLNE
mmetsp:Transcript_15850/g.49811  ORF Transcript_15850/g.49811 Transcript_15850/m.49811 type:complete len:176 (-) Transcript_15850:12-539(-)